MGALLHWDLKPKSIEQINYQQGDPCTWHVPPKQKHHNFEFKKLGSL